MDFEAKVSVMQNLKDLPHLPKPTHEGWMIGFRTWTLVGQDGNGHEICRVSEKRSNNCLKYVDFINHLAAKGYKLTRDQRLYLKYDGGLGFMDASWMKYGSYQNLVEIANLGGFSEQEARDVRHKP